MQHEPSMPEAGRQAAYVLLDALTGWSDDGEAGADSDAMNLALTRLNEVRAVTATIDDESDAVTIDASNLLGGTLVTMMHLVCALAEATGRDREDVIAAAREFLHDG